MRLIDADAFERRCMFDSNIEDMQDVIYALRDFPTGCDIEGIKADIKNAARKHLDIALSITDLSERKEHLKAEEALNYCVSLIDRHIKEYTE